MASLSIKDETTNALAEDLAARRGLTKTAAVRLALDVNSIGIHPTGARRASGC